MTNGDPKGCIFLFTPHINNGFFSLLTIQFHTFIFKNTPHCDVTYCHLVITCETSNTTNIQTTCGVWSVRFKGKIKKGYI